MNNFRLKLRQLRLCTFQLLGSVDFQVEAREVGCQLLMMLILAMGTLVYLLMILMKVRSMRGGMARKSH